jgi:hypothetical protein
MEKTVKYLILSIGMSVGAFLPAIFGASNFGVWSLLSTFVGGMAAVVFIYRLDS